MSEQINHHCLICGNGYHACDDCDSAHFKSWRAVCDTPKHYQIYITICSYQAKIITKQEAAKELQELGIINEDYSAWTKGAKQYIIEILGRDYDV